MIEWIVSSSILIAVIIALRSILRGRISLRLQYALWGIVLLRLLIPFSVGSSGLSVMNAVGKAELVQSAESISGLDTIEHMADGRVEYSASHLIQSGGDGPRRLVTPTKFFFV